MPSSATRRLLGWIFTGLLCAAAPAGASAPPRLTLEKVVVVMRHGVRPPTKDPAMPVGIARDAWPSWPVPPGHLTPHGAAGVRRLAAYDRADLAARGLFARSGCPAPASVRIWADIDERTIKTGEAVAEGFAPGCGLKADHGPEDAPDPLFSPLDPGVGAPFDARAAREAVLASLGPGGLQRQVERQAGRLQRLQQVLGCCSTAICTAYGLDRPCTLPDLPTTLEPAGADKPKMRGALDLASTAAQILLLQYVEGKPMSEVGWGRATKADVETLLAFHPLEYELVARPAYVSRRGAAPLLKAVSAAFAPGGPKLTVFVGHDTNIAHLGGALGLRWKAADYPANDPPPGGELRFELLRDAKGERYVQAAFEAQSMDQLRNLSVLDRRTPPARQVLSIAECGTAGGLCRLRDFRERIGKLPF